MCYKVLSFDNCILSCSHQPNIIQKSLTALKVSLCFNYANPFHLELRATTNLFIISKILPFAKCHINGIISYIAFSDWFLSLRNIHLRFMHLFAWLHSSFFFTADSIPLYGYMTVHLPFTHWRTSWLLPVFHVCELSCYKHSWAGFMWS